MEEKEEIIEKEEKEKICKNCAWISPAGTMVRGNGDGYLYCEIYRSLVQSMGKPCDSFCFETFIRY